MNLRIPLGLSLILTCCCTAITHADAFLTVETELVDAGDVALVGFFISSDAEDQLNSFNFPVDIGGDGPGLGPFLSFNTNSVQNMLAGVDVMPNFTALQNSLNGSDVLVNLTTPAPLALTETPVRLFDLVLDVDPDAPTGSIPVSVIASPPFFQFNVISSSGEPISVDAPTAGAVVIEAVPEPSSFGLLAIVSLGLASTRRRRVVC